MSVKGVKKKEMSKYPKRIKYCFLQQEKIRKVEF